MLWILSGILAMAFAFWRTSWINKQNEGNERMKTIGSSIADGAMAFLRAEYRILGIFVIAVAYSWLCKFWESRFKRIYSSFIHYWRSLVCRIPRHESSNKGKQSYNSCQKQVWLKL